MLELKFIKQILAFAFGAACLYAVVAAFYIKQMRFEDVFLLYVGNFLFAAVIGVFIGWFYKRHETGISSIRLVVIGAKTAVAGVVMAALLVFVLMLIISPAVFKPEDVSHARLNDAPGQFGGKNSGFASILYMNTFIGNLGASFFISLLIPFAVMKNLYGDEGKKNKRVETENPKKNYNL